MYKQQISTESIKSVGGREGGGVGTPTYARWKIKIEPLRETNVGVAQA